MSPADIAVLATVVGSVVLFGGATALALGWAFRSGQFDNFERGAASIFGPDEPIGEATDGFPGADATKADRVPINEADPEATVSVIGTPEQQRPWIEAKPETN